MARRGNTQAQVEDTTTEAPEVEEQTTEQEVAEASTEAVEVDLTPFKDAATAAVESADESTGDLSVEAIDSVNKVYREIDGIKGKNAARNWLDEEMKNAISVEKNIIRAKAFVLLKDGLTAGGGSSSPKAPADPTQAFVQKVVGLNLAVQLVMEAVPEGVAETWTDDADKLTTELAGQVESYKAYLASDDADAEAPEVSPVVRQAFKLAAGKGTGGGSRVTGGPRRDTVKHMEQVFADLESGSFLTINEIAKAQSTEYGDDRPSAGAVSARLFPKDKDPYKSDTLEAVAEEGKPRGARKL